MAADLGVYLFGASVLHALVTTHLKQAKTSKRGVIEEIVVYPIKGCQGISVNSAKVTPRGLEHDRLFMVVRKSETPGEPHMFISQRSHPKMCLVRTAIDTATGSLVISSTTAKGEGEGEEKCAISVPLEVEKCKGKGTEVVECTASVWGAECRVYDCGDEAADWFTAFLRRDTDKQPIVDEGSSSSSSSGNGTSSGSRPSQETGELTVEDGELRLVRLAPPTEFERSSDQGHGVVSFADQFPLLLASSSSLKALNKVLVGAGTSAVSMTNFRPNVVVAGEHGGEMKPWAEDLWAEVELGFLPLSLPANGLNQAPSSSSSGAGAGAGAADKGMRLSVPFPPCARCKVPTNDPERGILHPTNEPTHTMMAFRSGKALGMDTPKLAKLVFFGIHMAALPCAQGPFTPGGGQTQTQTASVGKGRGGEADEALGVLRVGDPVKATLSLDSLQGALERKMQRAKK